MKGNKWPLRMACGVLVALTILGVAGAAGTQGSEGNPLVTLSYLNEVVVPKILKQVEETVTARSGELKQEAMARNAGVFAVVELTEGKTVTLSSGAQVVSRSGRASTNDPMTDLTGGEAWMGGELPQNHLFLVTGDGQTVTALTTATLMIQGQYTVG